MMAPLTEEEKSSRPLIVEEVAEYLQIHPATVLKWIKAEKLKAYKVGREWRIKRDELESFMYTKPSTRAALYIELDKLEPCGRCGGPDAEWHTIEAEVISLHSLTPVTPEPYVRCKKCHYEHQAMSRLSSLMIYSKQYTGQIDFIRHIRIDGTAKTTTSFFQWLFDELEISHGGGVGVIPDERGWTIMARDPDTDGGMINYNARKV